MPKRYAVTDIGSNAVRLLIGVVDDGRFLQEAFIRLPLQLGNAAFGASGALPAQGAARLQSALAGMKLFVEAMQPVAAWRVVATAALRACANRGQIAQAARAQCGVNIEILSGEEEAKIIGRFVSGQFKQDAAVLNLDLGGGSTDCALIVDGKVARAATFLTGTARQNCGEEEEKKRMAAWLASAPPARVCGSGGSLRALVGICGEVNEDNLRALRARLQGALPAQIAAQYGLSPDRAANILPAINIYLLALAALPAGGSIAPVQGGLAEAILRDLAAANGATKI